MLKANIPCGSATLWGLLSNNSTERVSLPPPFFKQDTTFIHKEVVNRGNHLA